MSADIIACGGAVGIGAIGLGGGADVAPPFGVLNEDLASVGPAWQNALADGWA